MKRRQRRNSVSPQCHIEQGATVKYSIVMPGARVGWRAGGVRDLAEGVSGGEGDSVGATPPNTTDKWWVAVVATGAYRQASECCPTI